MITREPIFPANRHALYEQHGIQRLSAQAICYLSLVRWAAVPTARRSPILLLR